MADDNGSDGGTIRCPCGDDQAIDISGVKDRVDWVRCDDCDVWQHSICVGLVEADSAMPKQYYCEECQPEHHKRFEVNSGSDNRLAIAKERQEMHKMMLQRTRKNKDANDKARTKWLIDEIMAIIAGQTKALDATWAKLSDKTDLDTVGITADPKEMVRLTAHDDRWLKDTVEETVRLSIRIVLNNATVSALEGFRARLVKVQFEHHEVVAVELWSLRTWLTRGFMEKMERVRAKEWLETRFGVQNLKSLGQANADLVRKYFNM